MSHKSEDELENEGIFDDNCMDELTAHDGHCPCCGSYTRTVGGNYAEESQQDICDDCGWKGAVDYA